MQVQNYAERWPAPDFNRVYVRDDATISKRAHARLVREARDMLEGYGLDFAQLDGPAFVFHEMTTATATWTHKTSGQEVALSEIWFNQKTGAIHQCGSNYGRLSL